MARAEPSALQAAGFHLLLKAGALDELLDALEKGAGHKYIRRIPTGNPKRKYRYVYSEAHAVAHGAEPAVGEKVRVKDKGQEGHYEVTHVHGDGHVTIKHDETGSTMKVHAGKFRDMLAEEHAGAVAKQHDAALKVHEQALKTGTAKQQARAASHLERLGLGAEAKKAKAASAKREKARTQMAERRHAQKLAQRPAANLDELSIKHRHTDMLPRKRKDALEEIKQSSGILDHDLAQADAAYEAWKGRGRKGPKPQRRKGGELDAFEADLPKGKHFGSLLEAFEYATKGAKTWRDLAPAIEQLREVPGFENARLPDDALLRHALQDQERREIGDGGQSESQGYPASWDDLEASGAYMPTDPDAPGADKEPEGGDTPFDFGANAPPDDDDLWSTPMYRSETALTGALAFDPAKRRHGIVLDLHKADGGFAPTAVGRKGEGSRGGKIVGHTSGGQPIYASAQQAAPGAPKPAVDPKVQAEHAKLQQAHAQAMQQLQQAYAALQTHAQKHGIQMPAAAGGAPAPGAPGGPPHTAQTMISKISRGPTSATAPTQITKPGTPPPPAPGGEATGVVAPQKPAENTQASRKQTGKSKPAGDGAEFQHLSEPVSGETPEQSVPYAEGLLQHGIVGHTQSGKQIKLGMDHDKLTFREAHEASLLHRNAQEHLLNAARHTGNPEYKKAARSHLDEEFALASKGINAQSGFKPVDADEEQINSVFARKSLAGWERLASWHPSPMWAGENLGASFNMLLHKALGGQSATHKYIKRTPRPGGGYDYEYTDTPHSKQMIEAAPIGSTIEAEHNGSRATYTKQGKNDWRGVRGGSMASGWFVGKPATLTHGTPHPGPVAAVAHIGSMETATAKPFSLTATPVQQGLFGGGSFEKKPAPKVHDPEAYRQTSMFGETPKPTPAPAPSPMAEAVKEAAKQPAAEMAKPEPESTSSPEREPSPEENRAMKANAEREKRTAVMLERAKETLDFQGSQLDPRSPEYQQLEDNLANAQDDYDAARETAAQAQERVNERIRGEGESLQRKHEFGSHVGGSRKDMAEIRKLVEDGQLDKVTPADAARYLTKTSMMPVLTTEHYKSMGATPGGAHMGMVLSSLVATRPSDDSAEGRASYVEGVRMVAGAVQKIRTPADARTFQEECRRHVGNAGSREVVVPAEHLAAAKQRGYGLDAIKARNAAIEKLAASLGTSPRNLRFREEDGPQPKVYWTDTTERERVHDVYRALGQRFIAGLNLRVPQKGKYSRSTKMWGSDTTYGAALQKADALDGHREGEAAAWKQLDELGAAKAAEKAEKAAKRKEGAGETAEERQKPWRRSVAAVPDLEGTKVPVAEIDHTKDASLFGAQERVGKTFGFTAVQPGESLLGSTDEKTGKFSPSKKGREDYAYHLRHTEMAFHDLADALGLSPQQVSLNGKLAVAIAARGTGGANAHYESHRKVINVTRFRGAGALAHEWAHFLDNVMAEVHGSTETSKHGAYASHGHGAKGMSPELSSAFKDVMSAIKQGDPASVAKRTRERAERKQFIHDETTRLAKEVTHHDAQRRTVGWDSDEGKHHAAEASRKRGEHLKLYEEHKQLQKERAHVGSSTFLQHAHAFEPTNPGNYWGNDHELFARAFEAFVQDKLEVPTSSTKGKRRNSYLVDGTRETYKTGRKMPDGSHAQMYPHGEERHRINAAFEKLIGVMHNSGAFKKALKTLSSRPLTARRGPKLVIAA